MTHYPKYQEDLKAAQRGKTQNPEFPTHKTAPHTYQSPAPRYTEGELSPLFHPQYTLGGSKCVPTWVQNTQGPGLF